MTTNQKRTKRQSFSPEDDEKLYGLVKTYGEHGKWGIIAEHMEGHTARKCRERWRNYLSNIPRDNPFTEIEDQIIKEKVIQFGEKWNEIAKSLNGRTGNQVRLRYSHLNNKKYVHHKFKTTAEFKEMVKCGSSSEYDSYLMNDVEPTVDQLIQNNVEIHPFHKPFKKKGIDRPAIINFTSNFIEMCPIDKISNNICAKSTLDYLDVLITRCADEHSVSFGQYVDDFASRGKIPPDFIKEMHVLIDDVEKQSKKIKPIDGNVDVESQSSSHNQKQEVMNEPPQIRETNEGNVDVYGQMSFHNQELGTLNEQPQVLFPNQEQEVQNEPPQIRETNEGNSDVYSHIPFPNQEYDTINESLQIRETNEGNVDFEGQILFPNQELGTFNEQFQVLFPNQEQEVMNEPPQIRETNEGNVDVYGQMSFHNQELGTLDEQSQVLLPNQEQEVQNEPPQIRETNEGNSDVYSHIPFPNQEQDIRDMQEDWSENEQHFGYLYDDGFGSDYYQYTF